MSRYDDFQSSMGEIWWKGQDSNLCRDTPTDLQSVAFDRSATLPDACRRPIFRTIDRRAAFLEEASEAVNSKACGAPSENSRRASEEVPKTRELGKIERRPSFEAPSAAEPSRRSRALNESRWKIQSWRDEALSRSLVVTIRGKVAEQALGGAKQTFAAWLSGAGGGGRSRPKRSEPFETRSEIARQRRRPQIPMRRGVDMMGRLTARGAKRPPANRRTASRGAAAAWSAETTETRASAPPEPPA